MLNCRACGAPHFDNEVCLCGCGELFFWVDTTEKLNEAVEDLLKETVIGLDVEATWGGDPCLIQIAGERTYLIDLVTQNGFRDKEFTTPLKPLMENVPPLKLAHNASFERRMMRTRNIELRGVVDTLTLSRKKRKGVKGHSLQAVCARELNVALDKTQQKSRWVKRPLSSAQLIYAARDAQVLLDIYEKLA